MKVRSTQITGKEILAAAVGAVDETSAKAVRDERGWRFKYRKHFVKSVEVSARSPDAALKVAAAGLDYMYDKFEFIRDGKKYALRDALSQITGSFSTGFVKVTNLTDAISHLLNASTAAFALYSLSSY